MLKFTFIINFSRFSFAKDFVFGPHTAIENSDVVAVIHDISNSVTRHKLDPRVVRVLKEFQQKPAILILNKVRVSQCVL